MQLFRGSQAFAYPAADLDILDATIKGVVKQGWGIEFQAFSCPRAVGIVAVDALPKGTIVTAMPLTPKYQL